MSHRIDTKVIHAGQQHDSVTGAVMQPIFQTSTYAQPWPAKHTGYEYSRTQNPTREALERCIAGLEGGDQAIAFASGLAATSTVMLALEPGSKILCGDDVYGGTYRVFTTVFADRGLHFEFADLTKGPSVIADDVDFVWVESPTNPLLKVTDIRAIVERAHAIGAKVLVDNTFATPYFQTPLKLGADLVLHSTTKYINGHSDVVGGMVIAGDKELGGRIRALQNTVGAVPGPWDSWLTLRGVKTLAIRMEKHQQNAQAILAWLQTQPSVKRIHYPLLKTNSNYAVAASQMSGFGGMVSFVIDCTLFQAETFCASTKLFTLAESLGGVESLIELPASMTHASIPQEIRADLGIVDGLIRLSIGIENAEDLIADLAQALEKALAAEAK